MSLFHRVDYVTLSESENETEIRTIEAELEQNGYPQRFIEQTKRKALRKYGKKPTEKPTTETDTCATASVPYVQKISEAIGRILRPLCIRTVMQSQERK